MQYGAEIFPYQRVRKNNRASKEVKKGTEIKEVVRVLFYFIASLLISRVMLVDLMAPFGIALLMAVILQCEEKIYLASACGTLVGYASLYNSKLENLGAYLTIIATVVLVSYILDKVSKGKKLIYMFTIIFVELVAYRFLIIEASLLMSFFSAIIETICFFPIYFILNYSIQCFKEIRTKHLFSNEEVISMAVTLSLVIAGVRGLTIFGVSIINLLALCVIIGIAYIKGSSVGAASGVAIGAIIGATTGDMLACISIYGLCGLTVGVFKESGKVLTAMSFIVVFCIIKIYSDVGSSFKIIEALISCCVFSAVPRRAYEKMALELDFERKHEYMDENYGDKIKKIILERLDNFSSVLSGMSSTLHNLVDNDNLEMKNKSTSLVQNLADRVCENCNMNTICWKREQYYTYNAFIELIQNYQEKKDSIPYEIQRKCVKRTLLAKTTEDIVNNYIINEMWRNRLTEGRELLAEQICNMASTIGEIVDEFNANIKFNNEAENIVRRILSKKQINFKEILCYNDKKDRLIVKLSLDACGGTNMCIKEVLPLLNSTLNKNMCVGDEGCIVDKNNGCCNITFEETPKFHIASYAVNLSKDGENNSGDSYAFYKLNDGTYMSLISDGMGSGPQANKESAAAVEMIERFTKSGFSKNTAINTVNSIMSLKFSADEKFSTLDLNNVDLYTGEVDFIKVGAVPSFIKSDSGVKTIKSRTLPIGVLDKVDIEVVNHRVKNGDVIIMVSDGVLDYNAESVGKVDWIEKFLENLDAHTPKDIAEEIIAKAKELSGGKSKDDMTVLVSKIYSLY